MDIINKYFSELTPVQTAQFDAMQGLYEEWNAAINVISRKDMEHLYEHHILHSLGIAKVIRFAPGTSVLDVGTGGGFPGIPLAILFPEVNFYLVDSIGKKIKVVNAVSLALGLKNVTADQVRAEEISEKFDFIISRAVTALPEFQYMVRKNITKRRLNPLHNGILYLKGGDMTEELQRTPARHQIYHLNRYFSESFFETKSVVHLWF
ncbi:MAG: 16S rRNA (guanine(527)-N(7))-methyltransferase RsmG [Lentimicrobium sp.]|jgi:16S rRNA (guanine527-N7)-methyltransferase|nr:16S rRNA (guanine(527)-N(7))-methyltransferase RsmG [Lentimicrobium sp.]